MLKTKFNQAVLGHLIAFAVLAFLIPIFLTGPACYLALATVNGICGSFTQWVQSLDEFGYRRSYPETAEICEHPSEHMPDAGEFVTSYMFGMFGYFVLTIPFAAGMLVRMFLLS